MRWVDCTDEQHGDAILAIFNEAIAHSTALCDYEPRTRAQMTSWFATKRASGFHVIGVESEEGQLMGFASYGTATIQVRGSEHLSSYRNSPNREKLFYSNCGSQLFIKRLNAPEGMCSDLSACPAFA